jgi:plasmid stabilization system protein ParE
VRATAEKVKTAFEVSYTVAAKADLVRMFDLLLDRARTVDELELAQRAIDAIRREVEERISRTPLVYRKATVSPFQRELIVPIGASGYIELFEIEGNSIVNILAVRHQLEDDDH